MGMMHAHIARVSMPNDSSERSASRSTTRDERMPLGLPGLDEVLCGGLLPGRAYLVRGGPGTGKTILGLHFLTAGTARGERSLLITLEEPEEQIRRDASAVRLSLDGVTFLDLSPGAEFFTRDQAYDVFHPAEVEREPTMQSIVRRIESLRPQRVFLEAMTQLRYLSPDAFQFHKQVLSFLRFLRDEGSTVLFSSEGSLSAPDEDLQFLSDGVIQLESTRDARSISIRKLRGSDFQGGCHSMRLTDHGMEVFPRLMPARHARHYVKEPISSGVRELDALLQGGIERGTVALVSGPTGVGKTTISLCFVQEAARRHERSVVYTFDESTETLLRRSEAIGIPVRRLIEKGMLSVVQVEPLRYTPDEFAHMIRQEVEQKQTRIVVIDSIAGYRLCLRGADLTTHLHAIGAYLRNMGATALFVNEIETVTGEFRATELGISYLADDIVFLRYLELQGELRRAIGVLKKRLTGFESTLRELRITSSGVQLGKPLTSLRGILSGQPELVDGRRQAAPP